MLELAKKAIDLMQRKVDGHRLKGEALIELGQLTEDAEDAIRIINEGLEALKRAIALCSSNREREKERELEEQLLKGRKV
mmetsp:Transcript_46768/g.61868  ORF Transcript_46768/g.61868 Transcript_46768/m.61868 type:complete len:80 (-) Transcript_46768:568-807(-)|eukprot:CAMPEP_0170461156 /NCGR_PEP_ID=MMETSP0123-20130129/7183_1 /TAXON_ID=182087 /ORGANISM="Favella ehrenbergii, Strain Fehren 1" /LENGTH=79 /DNA_ID=CAMNT_0010726137 /DNA_START=323 /DNA_END=562 /DNA_ORIENTATION=+